VNEGGTFRELEGTAAIVTGSTGIRGRDIALALADAGAGVVINARSSADAAAAVVKEIEDRGGRAIAHLADITAPDQVEGMVDAAVDAFGRLDILVNNVGANARGPITELAFEDWRSGISKVLDGAFLCIKSSVPHMARGGRGAIVNIGSSSAHVGSPNHCVTAAAKMGIAGLTGSLGVELAPQGITVNCVALGYIERPGGSRGTHFGDRAIPMGRAGQPEDLTPMIRFLCSPNARYITGQTIHVNGGWYVSVN
jgi:3-oxoacyl-[acyl-carrier protein] reductase